MYSNKNKVILFAKVFFAGLITLIIYSGNSVLSPIAIVQKTVGEVGFKKVDAEWQLAKKGITLEDEDALRTASRSLAVVSFIDGSILRVRENSELIVYGVQNGNLLNKNVEIRKGKFGFEVKPQKNEEFRFITPSVVASIKGTEGYLEVSEDSSTVIFLSSGSIQLESSLGGKMRGLLSAGNSATISPDGEITIREATDTEVKSFKRINNTQTKVIKIKTSGGTVEIEYLDESGE
ncbi:MAG: FecR family protein [bacterium]